MMTTKAYRTLRVEPGKLLPYTFSTMDNLQLSVVESTELWRVDHPNGFVEHYSSSQSLERHGILKANPDGSLFVKVFDVL